MRHTLKESWVNMQLLADGKIYVIPRNTIARADGYAIRTDWLKNVGLQMPADRMVTLDQFTEIIKRFTETIRTETAQRTRRASSFTLPGAASSACTAGTTPRCTGRSTYWGGRSTAANT